MDAESLIINLQNIAFRYPGAPTDLLDNLDFRATREERIGISGKIGCGKTTLFLLLLGLLRPRQGSVEVLGQPRKTEKDFRDARRAIGLLFQNANDQLFSPTVAEDVAFGPLNLGVDRHEVRHIVSETLEAVGLKGYENRISYRLSGGEKKLAALASVLAMKPQFLLLDEPFAGLDPESRHRVAEVIKGSGMGYIMVSHRMDELTAMTDSLFRLEQGKLVQGPL